MFYAEQVELRLRSAMAKFRSEHTRYYTLNSGDCMTRQANKVKVQVPRLIAEVPNA